MDFIRSYPDGQILGHPQLDSSVSEVISTEPPVISDDSIPDAQPELILLNDIGGVSVINPSHEPCVSHDPDCPSLLLDGKDTKHCVQCHHTAVTADFQPPPLVFPKIGDPEPPQHSLSSATSPDICIDPTPPFIAQCTDDSHQTWLSTRHNLIGKIDLTNDFHELFTAPANKLHPVLCEDTATSHPPLQAKQLIQPVPADNHMPPSLSRQQQYQHSTQFPLPIFSDKSPPLADISDHITTPTIGTDTTTTGLSPLIEAPVPSSKAKGPSKHVSKDNILDDPVQAELDEANQTGDYNRPYNLRQRDSTVPPHIKRQAKRKLESATALAPSLQRDGFYSKFNLSLEDFKREQDLDPHINNLKHYVTTSNVPLRVPQTEVSNILRSAHYYVVINDVLYRFKTLLKNAFSS